MRVLLVGDIHGCYWTLQALLKKMGYDSVKDRLILLGDLVGKGPHDEKVLDWACSNNIECVLGNHDLYWMKDFFLGKHSGVSAGKWYEYLSKQSILKLINNCWIVHASLEPSWSQDEALLWAQKLEQLIQENPGQLFGGLSEPLELKWSAGLSEGECLQLALHIFVRARYYTNKGMLELSATGHPEEHPHLVPWYETLRKDPYFTYFGHWARLNGASGETWRNLDGGAVYGGSLLGYDMTNHKGYSCKQEQKDGRKKTSS